MLKRKGANTDPSRTLFFRSLNLLLGPVPVVRVNLRLRKSTIKRFTMCLSGTNRNSLQMRPRCHTGSYAAVTSTNIAPAFFLAEQLFSIFFSEGSNLIHSKSFMSEISQLVGQVIGSTRA